MPANSITKSDVIEVFESDQKTILNSVDTILKIVTQKKNHDVSTSFLSQQIMETNDRLQDMKHKNLELADAVDEVREITDDIYERVNECVIAELEDNTNSLKDFIKEQVFKIVQKQFQHFREFIHDDIKKTIADSLRPAKRLRPSERDEIEEFSEDEHEQVTVKRTKLTVVKK